MIQAETEHEHRRLAEVQQRLQRWRQQHGGPGRPIPEEFWSEAVGLARVFGAGVTARALGVDRERLERRSESGAALSRGSATPDGFLEVDTRRLLGPAHAHAHAVLRLERPDGHRLELELDASCPALDVVALARAFWARG
jgi:hypothetical protein